MSGAYASAAALGFLLEKLPCKDDRTHCRESRPRPPCLPSFTPARNRLPGSTFFGCDDANRNGTPVFIPDSPMPLATSVAMYSNVWRLSANDHPQAITASNFPDSPPSARTWNSNDPVTRKPRPRSRPLTFRQRVDWLPQPAVTRCESFQRPATIANRKPFGGVERSLMYCGWQSD